ncbi:CBS domain-containing protein [Methanosphaera sp. WGK6]|uniref:CBS domain-containing protein n=1 Tax=Methanosphaera sp. WGK6 TaxID=1561964 RepID=UPI0013017989|nr:CBS domain-containing protein [Methanosphaera sp. WGK6]
MKNKIMNKINNFDDFNLQTKKSENDGDIMSIAFKDIITASQSATIIEIANLMVEKDIRRVPITDPGSGKLLGIVTTMDILDFFGGGKKYNLITEKHKGNFLSAINAPIREIMTSNVKTMTNKDTIIDAATLMLEEHIGGCPIVNSADEIVGMVTEGDVVSKFDKLISDLEVQNIMATDIITTTPGTRIEGIAKIMVRNSLRRVPIVGENPQLPSSKEELLGFVTASDILKYIGQHKLFTKLFSNDGNDVVDITVDELMITDIITASKYDKLGDIANTMFESNIRGIPVVDDDSGKIIGIITIRDLLKAIVQ